MKKLPETRYPIHDLLRRRWSPRAFSNRQVESETICSFLEAARWAASSNNEQPWRFIIATKENQAEYNRLLSCLKEGNIRWAQHAPVLILSVAKLYFDRNGNANKYAFHDVGLAVQNLIIQATALDLFAHQMAGFYVEKARDLFNIPEGYEPVTMIALGYSGDLDTLSEDLREREIKPRLRQPLESFVFGGSWEKTSSLVERQD